jgi:N-acetylglucosaminyldiphosphoundecaprenol N-acetyl-beta-D-mannosaminyltransferase
MRHPDPNFGYPSLSFVEHERMLARLKHKPGKNFMRRGAYVLDSHIDAITWEDVLSRIVSWGSQHQSRYVTLCNVHSLVTATQCPSFNGVIGHADLALPDGAPVAWALRREGFPQQQRINGPDLTWRYLEVAEKIGQRVFFYGSSEDTLAKLEERIKKQFPKLHIAGMVSPPFRNLSPEEDQAYVDQINQSGAHVLFVGLGCPKQEAWMAAHRGRIQAVMLGVGAAFDYHAGTIERAPKWMQKIGMEWLHRLCSEPRRLAKRYAVTNSVFIYRMTKTMAFGNQAPPREESR